MFDDAMPPTQRAHGAAASHRHRLVADGRGRVQEVVLARLFEQPLAKPRRACLELAPPPHSVASTGVPCGIVTEADYEVRLDRTGRTGTYRPARQHHPEGHDHDADADRRPSGTASWSAIFEGGDSRRFRTNRFRPLANIDWKRRHGPRRTRFGM